MKMSIKTNFTLIFIGLMTGTLLLCWFINSTFLEDYYLRSKQEKLFNAYESINQAASEDVMHTEGFDIVFEKICATGNLSILIIDSSTRIIKSSSKNDTNLNRRLMDHIFGLLDGSDRKVLVKTENYIVEITKDAYSQLDYIELWGELDNGNKIIMRSAVESIRQSVDIANRFLSYVAVIGVLLSAVVISYVTRKITAPVLELADISERMTHLDFEARYINQTGSVNEITHLGEHINQLSATLQETISELKTANNELQTDIERKNEIDEMRKEFLSNVSHELKTPIALIQGYAEGLKEGINDDEESREFYCDVIIDEADKMNKLVKNLLTLNQLEFGHDTVTMERFDITELVRNCIQSVDILLKQKDIRLSFRQQEPIYVWADEFKTEQVFTNYLSNAIHHAEDEKHIEVKIEKRNKVARISVFNTGAPIPEEALAHLWTKFYKVDKARTREYGGNGVGLSIVKAIMDSFHKEYGVINYENGVAFWFELDYS